MSGGADSGGEKTEEPTEKKLQDARKKGDIAKSPDLSATAAYLGLALVFSFAGPSMINQLGEILTQVFENADKISSQALGTGGIYVVLGFVNSVTWVVLPVFIAPFVAVIISVMAQQAFVFAPDKILPKLSRISPLSGLKNKFGPTGLFEFAKNFLKLIVISSVVGLFVSSNYDDVLGSIYTNSQTVSQMVANSLVRFLWLVFLISAIVSVLDYYWQQFDYKRKLMMTRQEITDEMKDSEGDPHMKHKRRQKGHDIASQKMMTDVPDADVIVVNPQHFAVALKWDRATGSAPVCVAKGVDEIAARIREIAAVSGVPIHRDPPTARSLFATVEIGQEVNPDHYKPVAAAIRYAEKMRKLADRKKYD
ncbi:MAG: flagellar biosynthesis protein FlhB [Alphaproteobacteria bacterium]|nr:flagellar biosynthesis protein FlhB [Alphaproteobacteria bacterium]